MQEDVPDFVLNKIPLNPSPESKFEPQVTIPSPLRAPTINISLPPMQIQAFGRNFVAAEYPPLVKKDLMPHQLLQNESGNVSFPPNQDVEL